MRGKALSVVSYIQKSSLVESNFIVTASGFGSSFRLKIAVPRLGGNLIAYSFLPLRGKLSFINIPVGLWEATGAP